MNNENLIVVCSKNQAKNAAVENVVKQYLDDYKILSLDTVSKVSETPIGDDEGITGCLNRIKSAISQVDNAKLYIAMEGILTKNDFGTYLCGWTVIFNKEENEYYYGCSAKIKIPDEIIKNLNKSERLSKKVADYMNSTDDEISLIGTNGILTHGVYTRTCEFIDSITCAISSKYEKKRCK